MGRDVLMLLTAIFLLMPCADWIRLRRIDVPFTGTNQRRPDLYAQMWTGFWVCIVMAVGVVLLVFFWQAARTFDAPMRTATVIGSLVVFVALRYGWFTALRRFYTRHDL